MTDGGEFRKELTSLLNKNCKENESNTPDFILAEYMLGVLELFDASVNRREEWHGRSPSKEASND